ncbi:hypothetical protein J7E70_00780 [Variovorax paradoxus]|nr:hypothetical protein [Variovorax paradoxus]MBT2298986.1 hypothetical protein [Variovorax paradoxus]
MKLVSFSLEQGSKYFGKIDGERFFVGTRVPYDGGKGLMNTQGTAAQRYDRAAFRGAFGFWADFIHPTAMAEGAQFHTLNTYDRARFTFSFLQFAAHVTNGDFVHYLRRLLELPLAAEYFPDLQLSNGRVCRVAERDIVPLESDDSTDGLLDYLNPSLREIEDTEIIQAAKFVHWAQNDARHRELQIEIGIAEIRKKMAQYSRRYRLDGATDVVCLLVMDIRHQGRATSDSIVAALQSSNPVARLLEIGASRYPNRIAVLRKEINALTADGTFGALKYSDAAGEFVDA